MDDAEFPEAIELPDPRVSVYLTGGTVITLSEVSVIAIAKRLRQHGFTFLSDGEGDYCILFEHGVSALTAGKE
jgi:hypothetical protein